MICRLKKKDIWIIILRINLILKKSTLWSIDSNLNIFYLFILYTIIFLQNLLRRRGPEKYFKTFAMEKSRAIHWVWLSSVYCFYCFVFLFFVFIVLQTQRSYRVAIVKQGKFCFYDLTLNLSPTDKKNCACLFPSRHLLKNSDWK